MNYVKKMRLALWLILILAYIAGFGRTLIAIPFSIVNVIINGPDAVLSGNILALARIIYCIIESLLFVLLIRKETLSEFKKEKFDKKVLLFMGMAFAYAAIYYAFTQPEPTQYTPTRYIHILIIAPIFEEIMYRGAFQRTLKQVGGIKFSIICTTIMFSAAHMNCTQTPFVLPLGLLLGYVAEYYSLKCAILVHSAANSLCLINMFNQYIITILAMVGCIYIIVMIIIKRKSIITFFRQKGTAGAYKKFFLYVPTILIFITLILCLIGTLPQGA